MNPSEKPNPEHRSNNALLCFCIGAGMMGVSWLLGVGAVIGAGLGAGDPVVVAGGVGAALALTLAAICGFVLMAVGGVWMLLQVIADQRGEADEKRYRNIER